MSRVLSALENRLVDIDKRTLYHWLRHDKAGSRILRYIGGYIFWILYARRPYVGTRVAEIPWAMTQIKNNTSGTEKLLLVGDVLTQKLASMGYEVELVDMDAEASSGPRVRVQKMDIREASLPQSYFDAVISISTLEHVGIQGMVFPDGDRMAVELINRSLKPNGLFLFTVPFGQPTTIEGFTRIYDQKRLDLILAGQFIPEEITFEIWNGFRWRKAPLFATEKAGFLKNMPQKYLGQNCGLAMVRARKLQA